ncbi:MAG: hypothetical protein L0229_19275 [Blastocatellia bacterium]|nr:hypothetical protein [Blastocatellia bacterium]
MRAKKRLISVLTILVFIFALALLAMFDRRSTHAQASSVGAGKDWPVYGGGSEGIRYSKLKQINRENAKNLQVAWTFDTGDAYFGSELQCNPLVIKGVLYATTPKVNVIALDGATASCSGGSTHTKAARL